MKKNLVRDFRFDGVWVIHFAHTSSKEKKLILSMRNNPRVRKWMFDHHRITLKEHARFLENITKDASRYYWLLRNLRNEYLGVISLSRVDFKNKNAYLGIYVNPYADLKGLGSVLMNCLKKIAFGTFDLHTLKLEVFTSNDRAVVFYKKHGFLKEGRMKEFVLNRGAWNDVFVMSLKNG